MAIDFMVMPLSRYLSGDFITPAMRAAWDLNVSYFIVGPDGKRELPPGIPFGGPDAAAQRERIMNLLLDDLRALPAPVPDQLWDERSGAEPCIERVDVASYQALLESMPALRSGLGGWFQKPRPAHCTATLFLPCDFEQPIAMNSPIECSAGSTDRALLELAAWKKPKAEAAEAAATLRATLEASHRLRLPLIVDQ